MSKEYYQQQLQNLRELGKEFSRTHPAIAPMLSGAVSDPDVERILEGVAFLTGLLQKKLDDEFPEIIHGLMDIIFPHYLRPIPSLSIVVFTPKASLQESLRIPAGTSLNSIPVEDTNCTFRTCYDTILHPMKLEGVKFDQTDSSSGSLQMTFQLNGTNLSEWQPGPIEFLIGGGYTQASNLFLLLSHYLKRIVVTPEEGGGKMILPPQNLIQSGFSSENTLIPFPVHSFSGFRLIQEYFILPQKFLFMQLTGLDNWKNRGEGETFSVSFEFEAEELFLPNLKKEHILLYATPVINLFKHEADPVILDPYLEKVSVRPSSKMKDHFKVFSVDQVTGYKQGSVTKKEYVSVEQFSENSKNASVYQVIHSVSPIDNSSETSLAFALPQKEPGFGEETLSIALTCTNGTLAENLHIGDIKLHSSDSPVLADFYNIIPPTTAIDPPLGQNTLWKLLSHISLNLLSLAEAGNLKEILKLYIYQDAKNRAITATNIKRVDGILDLVISPSDRIVNGAMLRGQKISMLVRKDYYAGLGDIYLFGSVMEKFFGLYSSMNTFIEFELKESISGEKFKWPARIGEKPLI